MRNLAEEIERTRKIIKKKYEKLKHDTSGAEIQFAKTYKPIIEPLNKLVKHQKNVGKERGDDDVVEKNDVVGEEDDEEAEENVKALEFAKPNASKKRKVADASAIGDTSIFQPEKYRRFDDDDDLQVIDMELDHGNDFDEMISTLPLISQPYIRLLYSSSNSRDNCYGPFYQNGEVLKLGTKSIVFRNDDIQIGNKTYPSTEGLHELIFKKKPEEYTEYDLDNYREIIKYTGLHLNSRGKVKSNCGYKYKKIIKPLLKPVGKGVFESSMKFKKNKTYEFWDNPNELVNRLRLLISEKNAGNNNHQNEIYSILEELEEAKIINKNARSRYALV